METTKRQIDEAYSTAEALVKQLTKPQGTTPALCWTMRIERANRMWLQMLDQDPKGADELRAVKLAFVIEVDKLYEKVEKAIDSYTDLCKKTNIEPMLFDRQCNCTGCIYFYTVENAAYYAEKMWADGQKEAIEAFASNRLHHKKAAQALDWPILPLDINTLFHKEQIQWRKLKKMDTKK